ncbi:MAG: acetylglutamate kinase [Bacteroidota bacterium]
MLYVLKIGGNILNQPASLEKALDYFSSLGAAAILVHGGGRKADEVLRKMAQEPVMIDGRRITDAATLKVVTMVYAGLLNKNIVAALQKRGVNAIGLSGADGNLILANKRPVIDIDYGYAGDIISVNATFLNHLLALGLSPVLCSITHNGMGTLLNTNADTITNKLAQALVNLGNTEVCIQYCFELPGVLEDIRRPDSVIPQISPSSYRSLRSQNVISAGMLPKLDNAFTALEAGVKKVMIGNIDALAAGKGTHIVPD